MNDQDKAQLLKRINNFAEYSHQSNIEPSKQQFAALLELDNGSPWHFVNLLAFHDQAQYPEGHELADNKLTGEQAYDLYGTVAFDHVLHRGGELVSLNAVQTNVIGQTGNWARMATIKYPTIMAFLDMVQDPDYRAALVHRQAGLKETVLLATQPLL